VGLRLVFLRCPLTGRRQRAVHTEEQADGGLNGVLVGHFSGFMTGFSLCELVFGRNIC